MERLKQDSYPQVIKHALQIDTTLVIVPVSILLDRRIMQRFCHANVISYQHKKLWFSMNTPKLLTNNCTNSRFI